MSTPAFVGPEYETSLRRDASDDVKRNKDGSPRRKPGPKPGTPRSDRAPRSPRGTAPRAAKRMVTDFRPGINGIFQMVALPLAFGAPADAAALGHHGPQIAEALNSVAQERPEVAAALERVLSMGPYGLLVAAVVPLAVQLAHNHGMVPERVAVQLGATPLRVILAQLAAQAQDTVPEDVDS